MLLKISAGIRLPKRGQETGGNAVKLRERLNEILTHNEDQYEEGMFLSELDRAQIDWRYQSNRIVIYLNVLKPYSAKNITNQHIFYSETGLK